MKKRQKERDFTLFLAFFKLFNSVDYLIWD